MTYTPSDWNQPIYTPPKQADPKLTPPGVVQIPEGSQIGGPDSPFNPKWSNQPVPTGPDGRPLAPGWESLGDTQTGLLKNQYQIQNQLNTGGLDALRAQALRDPGTASKWAQMAKSQQMNDLAKQQAGRYSQAQSGLSMQGGLRTGARERLAQQNMVGGLQAQQGVGSQIKMQDEQNRLQSLSQLPGAELAAANYGTNVQDKNIQNTLNEVFQGRAAQNNQYNEAMRGWAAERTARATPSSSKK